MSVCVTPFNFSHLNLIFALSCCKYFAYYLLRTENVIKRDEMEHTHTHSRIHILFTLSSCKRLFQMQIAAALIPCLFFLGMKAHLHLTLNSEPASASPLRSVLMHRVQIKALRRQLLSLCCLFSVLPISVLGR